MAPDGGTAAKVINFTIAIYTANLKCIAGISNSL
jgi:hypothetical protein